MRDDIIDVLESYDFVDFFAEENWESDLEDSFDFEANCQDDHGHNEGGENVRLLTRSFLLKMLLNLGYSYEYLLQMVAIQWNLIDMSEDPPIAQMANKTYKLRSFIARDLRERRFDVFVLEGGRSFSKSEISFLLFTEEIDCCFNLLSLFWLMVDRSSPLMIVFMMMVRLYWCFPFFGRGSCFFVMMDDVVDLLILINMRYHLDWKLFAVFVHFFKNLLFLDVDRLTNIINKFRFGVHIFHGEAELLCGEYIDYLTCFMILDGLIVHRGSNGLAFFRQVTLSQRSKVEGIRIKVLLNPPDFFDVNRVCFAVTWL